MKNLLKIAAGVVILAVIVVVVFVMTEANGSKTAAPVVTDQNQQNQPQTSVTGSQPSAPASQQSGNQPQAAAPAADAVTSQTTVDQDLNNIDRQLNGLNTDVTGASKAVDDSQANQ